MLYTNGEILGGLAKRRCRLDVQSYASRRCWLAGVRRRRCRRGLAAANAQQVEDGASREWSPA